jgi:hypothetical protein
MASGLGEFFFGNRSKSKRYNLLAPEQQQALQDYFSQGIQTNPLYQTGQNYLSNLLSNDPQQFQQFSQPYLNQFYQETAPRLAERFAGAGTGSGALSSSGFQNSLAQAGANLSSNLAGIRGGMQQQGLSQALGYAQQPISNQLGGLGVRSFENAYFPRQSGFYENLATSLAAGIGAGARGGF